MSSTHGRIGTTRYLRERAAEAAARVKLEERVRALEAELGRQEAQPRAGSEKGDAE